MSNELVAPDKFFLNRFGMNHGALERILGSALERKADYADLYFEYRSAEGLALEESMVNHTSKSVSHGVGVRVCAEDRTGYAYSDEVTVDGCALRPRPRARSPTSVARRQRAGAGRRSGRASRAVRSRQHAARGSGAGARQAAERNRRVVRAYDPRVKNVMASFACEKKIVMIVKSDGQGRRRRAAAVPAQRHRDCRRRQGSPDGLLRRRRARRMELLHRERPLARVRARSGAPGDRESRRRRCARGRDGRRARTGMAGDSAARSDWPRPRRRLQPQGRVGLCQSNRPEGRERALYGDRRRHHPESPRQLERRRRRHADFAHGADRKGHPARLSAGSDERAAHEDGADRQRTARELRAFADAADDQHLHAQRRIDARGNNEVGEERPLRGQLRRRPGRYHQRQIRFLRQRGVPDRRRPGDQRR